MTRSIRDNTPARKACRTPDAGGLVTLTIAGKKVTVAAADLSGPRAEDLAGRCRRASAVVVRLDDLLSLDDDPRFAVLDFAAGLGRAAFQSGGVAHGDLLDAVLGLAPTPGSAGPARRFRLAALEAAVLAQPDALDTAAAIARRLREAGFKGVRADSLAKDASEIARNLGRSGGPGGSGLVKAALPDAPVADDAAVPGAIRPLRGSPARPPCPITTPGDRLALRGLG